MAKVYKTNKYLLHEGKIVPAGSEVELSEEQAERLLSVEAVKETDKTDISADISEDSSKKESDQTSLEDLTHPQLDQLALEELEIPKEEYPKSADKPAKIKAIESYKQKQQENAE
jgi:hypothetical protein